MDIKTNPDQSRPIQTNPDQSRPIHKSKNRYINIITRV